MKSLTGTELKNLDSKKREAADWFCNLRDEICTVFEDESWKLVDGQLADSRANHGNAMAVVGRNEPHEWSCF